MNEIAQEVLSKGFIPLDYFTKGESIREYRMPNTNEIIDEKFIELMEGPGVEIRVIKWQGLDGFLKRTELLHMFNINAIPIRTIRESPEESLYEIYFAHFYENEFNKEKQRTKNQ